MTSTALPYVGPRPFVERDSSVFFGREAETDELLSLIIAHPVVLVYGQSGSGKTSLLNAGVLPLLRDEGFETLLGARMGSPMLELAEGEAAHNNRYVASTLRAWSERASMDGKTRHGTLREFLRSEADRQPQSGPRVAIFDQFEEFFAAGSAVEAERLEFVHQLRDALSDPLFRVVIAMREDSIASLHPFVQLIPGNLNVRFRLERLKQAQALDAVSRPLTKAARPLAFAPGVADKLVAQLERERVETAPGEFAEVQGMYVEPVQLQVVCESLWRDLPESLTTIEEADLERVGDVNKALSRFYEAALKRAATRSQLSEGALRRWFEEVLITAAGTRGMVFRGQEETGGIPNVALEVLEAEHVIRAELRAGSRWYELSHDTFIRPIQESNRAWRGRLASVDQTGQMLAEHAARWFRAGRADAELLAADELYRAKAWMSDPLSEELGRPDNVVAFIEASRGRQQRQSARTMLRLNAAFFLLGVAAMVAAGVAIHQWRQAQAALTTAQGALATAQAALSAEKIAKSAAASAETEARQQRDAAQTASDEANAARADAKKIKAALPTIEAKASAKRVLGIDVSSYQGDVDWVKMRQGGVVFAFVRATQATTFVDTRFGKNWSDMKRAGVLRGAYHMFKGPQEPEKQAERFLSTLGPLEDDDLPPALSFEIDDSTLGIEAITGARTWMNIVQARTKRRPILYSGMSLKRNKGDYSMLKGFPLWLGFYTSKPEPTLPSPSWSAWTFWQYTASGTVDGIKGQFDLNYFNGSAGELRAFITKSAIVN